MIPYGYPPTPLKNTTSLCRIAYTVRHDNDRKLAVYSAELLLPNIESSTARVNAFKPDPDLLVSDRSTLNDYRNSKYDRGHLTPFEDASNNSASALQTFYLSNVVPQNLYLNRSIWHTLENYTRTWANNSKNGVYVITGPVFAGKIKTIGNKVSVPTSMFKVIIDKDTNRGIGYMIPNIDPKQTKLDQYKVSISTIEKATKINFTPNKNNLNKRIISDQFK